MTDLETVLECIKGVHFEGGKPNCCILASLAIRDALRTLGFPADVKSVACEIRACAYDPPIGLHTLGAGMNKLTGEPYHGGDWDGHLVATTPDYVIDPTFGAMRRTPWSWIPNVAVIKRERAKRTLPTLHRALPVLASWYEEMPHLENYRFQAVWAANSSNTGWRQAPDFLDAARRRDLAQQMVAEIERVKPLIIQQGDAT